METTTNLQKARLFLNQVFRLLELKGAPKAGWTAATGGKVANYGYPNAIGEKANLRSEFDLSRSKGTIYQYADRLSQDKLTISFKRSEENTTITNAIIKYFKELDNKIAVRIDNDQTVFITIENKNVIDNFALLYDDAQTDKKQNVLSAFVEKITGHNLQPVVKKLEELLSPQDRNNISIITKQLYQISTNQAQTLVTNIIAAGNLSKSPQMRKKSDEPPHTKRGTSESFENPDYKEQKLQSGSSGDLSQGKASRTDSPSLKRAVSGNMSLC